MKLNYLKDFDTFTFGEMSLNEDKSLLKNSEHITRGFLEGGSRMTSDGIEIDPKEIVDTVEAAINSISFHYTGFYKFVNNFTMFYLWHHPQIRTMAVDDHMNIYIIAPFVKFGLKCDVELVRTVILHEILHVAFNHIERGNRWLAVNKKPLNDDTMWDNNLAGDLEVNVALCKRHMVEDESVITDEIHGVYLHEFAGNVPPMEIILEDENVMEKLRKKWPKDSGENGPGGDGSGETKNTTVEFDEGYVEMKNKISDLVNKYGVDETIKRLRDAGIISENGVKLNDTYNPDYILTMEFITLKTFDEYVNESNKNNNGCSTKEDGYRAALEQALKEMTGGGGDNGGGGGGTSFNTKIDQSELKPMKLPNKRSKSSSSGGGGGLPSNVEYENEEDDNNTEGYGKETIDDENEDSSSKEKGNSRGDNSKKSSSNNGGEGNEDFDINFGNEVGTGTYVNSKSIESSLEDSFKNTYGKYFDKIKDILDKNIKQNSKESIEKRRREALAEIKRLNNNDPIGIIWENGIKSSNKYKAMWKTLLRDFLDKKSRKAGNDIIDPKHVKYFNKRFMSIRVPLPVNTKKSQEPQDLNVYVDVSASINDDLINLMAKALVSFLEKYKYSGINVIPWANSSMGINRIDPVSKIGEKNAIEQIKYYIASGKGKCGGGTTLKCCLKEIVATTYQYKNRRKKDDVHIILTDGYFNDVNPSDAEQELYGIMRSYNPAVATQFTTEILKNCIWMIYDGDDSKWENAIKNGKYVEISSKNIYPD